MARLTKEEKRDLWEMAHSAAIKKDFDNIRKNRLKFLKKMGRPGIDAYIEFLSFVNAFANHARKPFHKIEGSNFKL